MEKKISKLLIVVVLFVFAAGFQEYIDLQWRFKSSKASDAAAKYEKGKTEARKIYDTEMARLKDTFKKELETVLKESNSTTDTEEVERIKNTISLLTNEGEVTSEDIPFEFIVQKSEWSPQSKTTFIWGFARNTTSNSYDEVKVVITAYDNNSVFLGRRTWHAEPSLVGPGQVAYLEEHFIETDKKPARLTFKVTGVIDE